MCGTRDPEHRTRKADLIMSGTRYKDAVKGTDFDDLDEETAQEFELSLIHI